jgi:hypothetical protein
MSKTFLLIFLAITSVTLCKNTFQFLSDRQSENEHLFSNLVKGFVDGLQVFKDIPSPPGCDITEKQSFFLWQDLENTIRIVADLAVGRHSLDEALPMLKETFVDLLRIYSELLPSCQDAIPAVKQRVHDILGHMSGLEYVVKFAVRLVMRHEEFYEEFVNADFTCFHAKDEEDTKRCGELLGSAIHDLLLWDFQN